MASSRSRSEDLFNADEEEEEEEDADSEQAGQQPSAKERAERAAAAAAARARGEDPASSAATASSATSTDIAQQISPVSNDAGSEHARGPAATAAPSMPSLPSATGDTSANDSVPLSVPALVEAAGLSAGNLNGLNEALAATGLNPSSSANAAASSSNPAARPNPAASSTPNDLVKTLSEQLECSICREIVYQPVSVLDCLHTFCGSCLIQWVSTHPGDPECPTCRSPARATKDSHQHNSLRDVLLRMDPAQDRTDDEKAAMRAIYTPGSTIDLVQTSRLVARRSNNNTGSPNEDGQVQGAHGYRGEGEYGQQPPALALGAQQPAYYAPHMQMRVMLNPIDELNLLLRYYFPCPTCEPGNPYRFTCPHPIPDPRTLLVMGGGAGVRPIPRLANNVPQGHTMCFNCKRPNLMPLRDRRQFPQDCCAICSERFCQNILGYCGPIKQPKARAFDKLDSYEMPIRQGLIASTFSNLFGTGSDPASIGTFMPHLFGRDLDRVRSFDVWLAQHRKMTLDDFYHAVLRHAIAASPVPLVVGGQEQGITRAPWQGGPGRYMRERIRKDDWVCANCAKDMVEYHAREWYNIEVQRDPPARSSPLFATSSLGSSARSALPARAPGGQQAQVVAGNQQQGRAATPIQAAQSGSFFSLSTLKKGFSDIGDKFNEMTTEAPTAPPPYPAPLPALVKASECSDRQVLKGNQLPQYPIELATSRDTDGHPVFLAIHHHSSGAMLPGKICPNLRNPVRVAWEGSEYALSKDDKYETFLENRDVHKWVRISNSVMPTNEIPVAAGMERDGRTPLFFAAAWHEGLRVPGYTGPNTMGARIAFGGSEVTVKEDYEVLVWRDNPDRQLV